MDLKRIQHNWNTALTQRDRDTVKLRLLGIVVIFSVLICLMGCGPTRLDPIIAKEYQKIVEKMRQTYEHISPRFEHYLKGDFSLDRFTRMNFMLSVAVWEGWLEKSEFVVERLVRDGILLKK